MTDINLQYLPNHETETAMRSGGFRAWPQIGRVARTIAVVGALMLIATVPMLLRMWLFFPAIHHP